MNELTLEYRQSYGSAAWASTKSNDSFTPEGNLGSPATAVGVAFQVFATHYPTSWVFQLDLGTFADGYGASHTTTNTAYGTVVASGGGGGIPLGKGQFDPLRWSYFEPVAYSYGNGVWDVEVFFPDQWLFNRGDLAQRFSFFATNSSSGPDNLVDGTTTFSNVRWILSSPFPAPGPGPGGILKEPTGLSLMVAAMLGMLWRHRRQRLAT